jgi:hypothetical protein
MLSVPKIEEYAEYLDEFEISDEQKNELLLTLWMIMVSFVDMHMGIDSVQILPGLKEIALERDSLELEQNKNSVQLSDTDLDTGLGR